MRVKTIEELLMKENDATLLNIYDELESGIVPATSYAHEYVRKVNRMINEGKLCVVPGKYRTVYLPTISKLIYKEMARRYAMSCYNTKTIVDNAYSGPTPKATPLERPVSAAVDKKPVRSVKPDAAEKPAFTYAELLRQRRKAARRPLSTGNDRY